MQRRVAAGDTEGFLDAMPGADGRLAFGDHVDIAVEADGPAGPEMFDDPLDRAVAEGRVLIGPRGTDGLAAKQGQLRGAHGLSLVVAAFVRQAGIPSGRRTVTRPE